MERKTKKIQPFPLQVTLHHFAAVISFFKYSVVDYPQSHGNVNGQLR